MLYSTLQGDMYSFQAEEPPENIVATAGVEDIVAEQSAEIKELRSLAAGCKEEILQRQLELEAMKQQVWEWWLLLERWMWMTYVVTIFTVVAAA